MALKTDLHIHTKEDPKDIIKYNAKQLISKAASLGFEVISITNHDRVTYDQELADFAAKNKILLIPGAELTINGKHVLVYNITEKERENIKTLEDLAAYKAANSKAFVVAPHPFFLINGISKELISNMSLFDAIEYNGNYSKRIDINKKAVRTSINYRIPLVANTDSHSLKQFNKTYSMINSEKNADAVFDAIRKKNSYIVTSPSKLSRLTSIMSKQFVLCNLKKIKGKILKRIKNTDDKKVLI